jgi:hypothetical protein
LTRALIDQQKLFEVDCVTVRFDAAVLAELAGIQVDWSPTGPKIQWGSAQGFTWPPNPLESQHITVLVEVIRRLKIELHRQVPILTVLPGPVSLWRQACPNQPETLDGTIGLVRTLAEEACRAGAELVILEETAEEADGGQITTAAESICNTVRYYNAFSVLQVSALPTKNVADSLLFQPQMGQGNLPQESRAGVFVPPSCLESTDALAEYVSNLRARAQPVFLTIGDDVLLAHPIEADVSLFTALRQVSWE